MFEDALEAFERNDRWGFLAHFAFIGKDGRYFVPSDENGADINERPSKRPQPEDCAIADEGDAFSVPAMGNLLNRNTFISNGTILGLWHC